MASPGLPEDITAGVTTGHVTDHEKIHDLLNEFDMAQQAQATGDLLVFQDGLIKRLPVGSDNQVLTADSTQPAGVKWATPTGGGGGGGLQVEWEDEVETGPAQDTATSGSYNRIEGVLVSLVPFFWVEAVTVYSNAAATYELVIGGEVVWTGALAPTGSGGSLEVLDEPVLLGSLPAPSTPVIWRVATATDVSLYGRDANYADAYFSMQANNPFRTVSGSGNSQTSYCPAFKIHGRPGNLDWQSSIIPPT